MFKPVQAPKIVVLGLGLPLYEEALPELSHVLDDQLNRYVAQLASHAQVLRHDLCTSQAQVAQSLQVAKNERADAVVVIAMCYTASLMSVPAIMDCQLPLVIWNTQDAAEITDDYDFTALLHNHTVQGTQDLASVLVRRGHAFGMESGHHQDTAALARLGQWLDAARALQAASHSRVGRLGRPFEGMGDFLNSDQLTATCGAVTIDLELSRFNEAAQQADDQAIKRMRAYDQERFETVQPIHPDVWDRSLRGQWALEHLIREHDLDAFTFNFMDLIDLKGSSCLPLYGINQLMAKGMGYAGEGDAATAALMMMMRQLVGASNFTEIYTIDFARHRMMMSHMQECNPALARRDQRIKLVTKKLWAQDRWEYVGMHFCLEPGPVTLVNLTLDASGQPRYLYYETHIVDHAPYAQFDIPHWVVGLDEPVEDFLTRYGVAGGTHHLVSVSGHQGSMIRKLAHLQQVSCANV